MLETLGNLGDFVGGIAVVLSLLYVAFQIREGRRQRRAQALQDRISMRTGIWSDRQDKVALREALRKLTVSGRIGREIAPAALDELDKLDEQERTALGTCG
jgi:hypothetical protein